MRHAVILSSYNRPTMVQQAIASVREQGAPHQLIVTDDGSDPATLRAIEAALDGDPDARLLVSTRARVGLGALRDPTLRAVRCINDALALVDADFVHYLPDDDWYAPGRFEAFEEWFARHPPPHHSVAYGRLHYRDARGKHLGELYQGHILVRPACLVDHGQFCHRAACLRAVPEWPAEPANFAFDATFMTALAGAGWPFFPVDRIVSYKRVHGKNLQRIRDLDIGRRD